MVTKAFQEKVNISRLQLFLKKMEFRSLAAQYVEWEIFLTPSQGSISVTFLVSVF